jgi:predicted Zn-dependent protease
MAGLSKELKDLDARVAALPKPAAPPDLAPLNAKLAALAQSVDAVGPLSKKVDALGARLDGLDKSVKSVQDDAGALKDQLASLRNDAGKPAEGETGSREAAKPVNVNVEGQSFSQAVALFKAGRYKEANEILKTTEENDPKDARVWYYAALSAGLATNQWLGDTQKLVMKGVEREKAGTPSTKEIDDEFSKLPGSQKNWLAAYRKLAQK